MGFLFQPCQLIAFRFSGIQIRDVRDLGHHFFDIVHIEKLFLVLRFTDLVQGTDFINHINRFIRQETFGNMLKCKLRSAFQGVIRILNVVILFKSRS